MKQISRSVRRYFLGVSEVTEARETTKVAKLSVQLDCRVGFELQAETDDEVFDGVGDECFAARATAGNLFGKFYGRSGDLLVDSVPIICAARFRL